MSAAMKTKWFSGTLPRLRRQRSALTRYARGEDILQIESATVGSGATQATLTASSRNAGDVVTTLVPPDLLVKQTYVILSEVSYLYKPAVGYVMGKSGIKLSDVSYTRPRQVTCVIYNNVPNSSCPTP